MNDEDAKKRLQLEQLLDKVFEVWLAIGEKGLRFHPGSVEDQRAFVLAPFRSFEPGRVRNLLGILTG